ncbi:MAG TPA: nitrous oxide reductase accessory protein NosL [Flavobacteriales bacterium]|nr:nitrous oxide reductase accessory protein NosL [Flavobacteriales bacterium]
MRRSLLLLLTLVTFGSFSCSQVDPTIDFGRSECAHCRMNVVDRQFAAAISTNKGRQYVFDDVSCMVRFVEAGNVAEEQVAAWRVCDHSAPGVLIDATTAFYLHGPAFRSPMRGDVAAFLTEDQCRKAQVGSEDGPLDWTAVRTTLAK